jgi:hypothetical protein
MSTHDDPRVGSARTATDRADAVIPEPHEKNAAEKAAPVTGTAAGALAGGTVGTLVAGPIGTAIGAIAGAVGGWWAGSGVGRSAELTADEENYYRTHYEASAPKGGSWERVRPIYQLGHAASANPAYKGRSFASIENDLRHAWKGDFAASHGTWESVRDLARCAYERCVDGTVEKRVASIGSSGSHRRAEFSDPLPHASTLSGASGHPGVAGGPGDIPGDATKSPNVGNRTDVGPHSPDVTGTR